MGFLVPNPTARTLASRAPWPSRESPGRAARDVLIVAGSPARHGIDWFTGDPGYHLVIIASG